MAKNLNELRDENPELAAAVECEIKAAIAADNIDAINRATEAERNRLAEIDEIARLYDDKTVREAKYGEHPCTAQEMAFKAATRAAKSGATFMQALISDYKASGVDEIAAIPGEEFEVKSKTTNQKVEEARLAIGSLLNQKKNGD